MRLSKIRAAVMQCAYTALPVFLAVPAMGGTIVLAPSGTYGSNSGPLAEASAFVHYSGLPSPQVSDAVNLSLPVQVTFLGGTGSGKFQACASVDTIEYYDPVEVNSWAAVSFGSFSTESGYPPPNNHFTSCSRAMDFTYGVPQVVPIIVAANVSADFLLRDPSRAFDVYATGTINGLFGYDFLTGSRYSLTYSWNPQSISASLESGTPEPASIAMSAAGLLTLLYLGWRRQALAISSSVRPLVSGTARQTTRKVTTHIPA